MTRRHSKSGERGAALVIVLLIVATLAFVAIAISEKTVLAASRAVNMRARAELAWRAIGVEALARGAVKAAFEAEGETIGRESPLFAQPTEIPMEDGSAVIAFADRTRCFNLNSLVTAGDGGQTVANAPAVAEFDALVASIPDAPASGAQVAAAIVDWIDADTLQSAGGAEDDVYAGMPTPYRTGATLLADVSEMRAMAGVSRGHYAALRPRVCALPNSEPAPININLLAPDDAPLLVALTNGELSEGEARDLIAATPAGGYENLEAFWAAPQFEGLEISLEARQRVKLTSRFVEAYAVISYNDVSTNLGLLFDVDDDGDARLIARRFERFE